MNLHPILPGAFCVPSAIQCLTGEDYESVIHPAINRHSKAQGLTNMVAEVRVSVIRLVLNELGYNVRAYKRNDLRRVETWALRSKEKYPGHALLVVTSSHAVVIKDGKVYDNHIPFGEDGNLHPYARDLVKWEAVIEKRG